MILPSPAYTEQGGLFENLEGRVQECKKASYPIGDALEDWKIFNLIIKKLNKTQDLSNFNLLRKEVLNFIPNFSKLNELPVYKDSINKKNESLLTLVKSSQQAMDVINRVQQQKV